MENVDASSSTALATSSSMYNPDEETVAKFQDIFHIEKRIISALKQCDGDENAARELMSIMAEEIQQQQDMELLLKMNSPPAYSFSTSSNYAANGKENIANASSSIYSSEAASKPASKPSRVSGSLIGPASKSSIESTSLLVTYESKKVSANRKDKGHVEHRKCILICIIIHLFISNSFTPCVW